MQCGSPFTTCPQCPNTKKTFPFHLPAGRSQEPELSDTEGCIRMADEDIKELKETTERLETFDPKEKEERILYVENDLEGELRYSDRESIKYDWIRFGGFLNAIIITPKK